MGVLRLLAVFVLISLAGCAVTPNQEEIGPYPDNYREVLKSHIERTFFDPYSLRSVAVSAPIQGHLYFQQGWIVCFQANGKNRMGGYVGLRRSAYLLNKDRVINSMEEAPLCNDSRLAYEVWPELEAGGVSVSGAQSGDSGPTLAQKEKWITTMARKNGCEGSVRVGFKRKNAEREIFEATCGDKNLEFTCEFSGRVSEAMGGIPFVAVTGKSYQTQPACWR